MTGIFRNNLFINALLLLPYALLLGIIGLLNPESVTVDAYDSQLTRWMLEYINIPMVQQVLSVVLVFVHASIINRIVIQNRIGQVITLLPGMFYILLMSVFPSLLGLSDFLFANTFFLLALDRIMAFYQKTHLVSQIFYGGLLLGLAILCVPQYLPLVLLGAFAVIYFNALNIKNIVQFVGGTVTIMLAYFQILFLYNFDVVHELGLFKLSFNNLLSPSVYTRPEIGFVLVLALLSILGFNGYGRKKSMSAQKKIHLLYYMLMSALVIALCTSDPKIEIIYLALIPAAVFMSMTFLHIKNKAIAEVVHIVLLALIAAIHTGVFPFLK